jgi:hypothetical protein
VEHLAFCGNVVREKARDRRRAWASCLIFNRKLVASRFLHSCKSAERMYHKSRRKHSTFFIASC